MGFQEEMMGSFKYDVFISYSHLDRDIANEICDVFEKYGITYFIDNDDIRAGDQFWDIIHDSILSSKVFLLIGSLSAYDSIFVKKELSLALEEEKQILPYIVDGSKPKKGVRLLLSGNNYLQIEQCPIYPNLLNEVLGKIGRDTVDNNINVKSHRKITFAEVAKKFAIISLKVISVLCTICVLAFVVYLFIFDTATSTEVSAPNESNDVINESNEVIDSLETNTIDSLSLYVDEVSVSEAMIDSTVVQSDSIVCQSSDECLQE